MRLVKYHAELSMTLELTGSDAARLLESSARSSRTRTAMAAVPGKGWLFIDLCAALNRCAMAADRPWRDYPTMDALLTALRTHDGVLELECDGHAVDCLAAATEPFIGNEADLALHLQINRAWVLLCDVANEVHGLLAEQPVADLASQEAQPAS